jgi:hypothetical protein
MRLRIATASRLPEPDPDERPLVATLVERGLTVEVAAWDDPGVPWDDGTPALIRSTWNYIHALPAFLAWSRRPRVLWNPAGIVAGNVHKRYLVDLAAAGHAVVPTVLVEQGQVATPEALAGIPRGSRIVVKPAVSAGSYKTFRFETEERPQALAQATALAVDRDVLIQPYLESVDGHGERALVWIAGTFTHAVRKSPRFAGQDEAVSAALPVEADEQALGEAILAPLASRLLYARVDVARDAEGRPRLMELELVEPSLFLREHPPAMTRLAEALVTRLA